MPKNKQRFNNFAVEVDFAHDEMSRRAQRTRNGRNKEEREHTMWVEGQVEQLCEAFPQIEECLVREIFLGAGMKYGTTADQLLVLSNDEVALSGRHTLFLKKQEAAKSPMKKPAFAPAKPTKKEFPAFGRFNEWEMINTDVITFDDEFMKDPSENRSWADMAKTNANDIVVGSARESICETDPIMSHSSKFSTILAAENRDRSHAQPSSDEEYSTSFQLRKGAGRRRRGKNGYATTGCYFGCEDEN